MLRRRFVLAVIAVLAAVLLAVGPAAPALAGDGAILKKALRSYKEASAILKSSRELEGEERQEASERALNLLRAAQELLEPIADKNEMAMDMIQEVQSLIYWTHKMTPIAPEKKEAIKEEFEFEQKIKIKATKTAGESLEETRERIAATELARIRAAEELDPESLEILAQYFRLADEYSDTRSGIEANRASIRLQEIVWGSKEEGVGEGEADWSTLDKRMDAYMHLRKSAICHKCEGEYFTRCGKCKGDGWIERYYGGGTKRKIDWNHSRACVCNPEGIITGGKPIDGPNAGKLICQQPGCWHGFMLRHFEKLVWDFRSPDHREQVTEQLDGANYEYYIKALASACRPNPMVGADDDIPALADEAGIDPSLLQSVAEAHVRESYARIFTRAKYDDVEKGNPEFEIRLEVVSNGKVRKTFREKMTWEWVDGEWYAVEPEE